MKKILLATVIISVLLFAFSKKECDHIYVSVAAMGQMQDTIERQPITWATLEYKIPSEDGGSFVCVKCYNVKKQIIKTVGWSTSAHTLTFDTSRWATGTTIDTALTQAMWPRWRIVIDSITFSK